MLDRYKMEIILFTSRVSRVSRVVTIQFYMWKTECQIVAKYTSPASFTKKVRIIHKNTSYGTFYFLWKPIFQWK